MRRSLVLACVLLSLLSACRRPPPASPPEPAPIPTEPRASSGAEAP